MKKILLGTTTLFGAALFAGAVSAAETPKITLGGASDFQLGVVGEDNDANLRSGAFRNESEINVKIDAKTDGGLGYGGQIDLAVSGHADQDNNTDQLNHSWMYLDGAWGRAEMGSTVGVTSTMKVGAESIARASGGVDGDFNYFMSSVTSSAVIATPDLFLDYGAYGATGATMYGNESQEAINKVNYYTPRFSGFQAGVSFLFDSTGADRGIVLSRNDASSSEAENIILWGLNYQGKFSNVGVDLAATGEWGNAETAAVQDLRTWNVGAKVSYMGFALAGSYGDYGDSMRSASNLDDNYYWTVGGSYETGPFGFSVTYLASNYEATSSLDNEFTNLSIGTDYKLAAGLTPYAEVSFVEVDGGAGTSITANDNDATVFIAGTRLSF